MKQFCYIVTDPLGIHARPAGILVKEAKKYNSKITLAKGDRIANALRLMAVMSLSIKCGDTVTVTVEGSDEATAADEFAAFLKKNL